jgi:hypothetical protein
MRGDGSPNGDDRKPGGNTRPDVHGALIKHDRAEVRFSMFLVRQRAIPLR